MEVKYHYLPLSNLGLLNKENGVFVLELKGGIAMEKQLSRLPWAATSSLIYLHTLMSLNKITLRIYVKTFFMIQNISKLSFSCECHAPSYLNYHHLH